MFDIQRFADTVTSSREGKLVVKFYDGDDRTITIYDPRDNLSAAELNDFVGNMIENQPIIGDKAGASLAGSANSFKIIEKTERKLDLR